MDTFPVWGLFAILIALIALSALFSGSETALMMVNRYRLKARAKRGQRGAMLARALLERPERLIGLILLCNTSTNVAAGAIATLIGLRLSGESGVAIATGALTFVLLIFGEVSPKTLAALNPERVALPAAYVYHALMRVLHPVVTLVTVAGKLVLRLFGLRPEDHEAHSMSAEELRVVVSEAGAMIPQRHHRMLTSILDLERATVEDIMVPRNEIFGLDLADPWEKIREDIVESQHTRLPVFEDAIDNLRGVIHLRRLVRLAAEQRLDKDSLLTLVQPPYFVPEGTSLNRQLLSFQDQQRRIGFVVDEYGDIQGLVTLDDILEEVVGQFTSDPAMRFKHIRQEANGTVLVSGAVTLRSINRALGWTLPTAGPKTLNGLVMEKLEDLPEAGQRLRIGDHLIEILETHGNAVKSARLSRQRASGRVHREPTGR